MCGFLGNMHESPLATALMAVLGLASQQARLRANPGTGPAAMLDIIRTGAAGVEVAQARWWLLQEKTAAGFRPSRYTSFNTRCDKLNLPRSAGYRAFRESRCIVPATFIIEGEGAKGARRYHRIEPCHRAFALGGLYRQWCHPDTGTTVTSCSIITLAPHPQWQGIHSKSTPLFLPAQNRTLIQQWLDPAFDRVEAFDGLMVPAFHDQLICTPIERPGHPVAVGETRLIGWP